MVNSPLIRPAIYWGGSFGGGSLGSHDSKQQNLCKIDGWKLEDYFQLSFWESLFSGAAMVYLPTYLLVLNGKIW